LGLGSSAPFNEYLDVIRDLLLKLRFQYGVEEVEDSVELISLLKSQPEDEEITYIYSPPGRLRPYLVSATVSGGHVVLAFADLDDVRQIKAAVDAAELEEASTVVVGNVAPFLMPLKRDGDVVYAVLGFKTVVEADVLTGGFLEALLEEFEWESDKYFMLILDKLSINNSS
jgi:hypothetical protein